MLTQWDQCEPQSIKLTRMDHLTRTTTNVQRLIDFYVKVLGFKQLMRPKFPFQGAWLELDNLHMHIIQRNNLVNTPEDPFNNNGESISPPKAIQRSHHIAFLTEDIGKVVSALNKMQIQYFYPQPVLRPGISKHYQLWFYDPDGNGIEVMQPLNSRQLSNQTSKL